MKVVFPGEPVTTSSPDQSGVNSRGTVITPDVRLRVALAAQRTHLTGDCRCVVKNQALLRESPAFALGLGWPVHVTPDRSVFTEHGTGRAC